MSQLKPFHFQQFTVQQSTDVFRVGTDAVLLGALCSVDHSRNILEVGTGTGIVSLMLAQRNTKAQFHALDIDPIAVKLAESNFNASAFSNRLKASLQDFKHYNSPIGYDHIVCNPPFFEANSSEKDVRARQQTELNFLQLLKGAKANLISKGMLSVILPSESANAFESEAKNNGFFLQKKISIYGREGGKLRRYVLEFCLEEVDPVFSEFVIEKNPRIFSDQYLELTKEFHVF